MKKSLIVFFFLLFYCSEFAGISTKKQDILKLIGNSHAPNGKFAWIEVNGEDYGWTRESGNVGKYKIVIVEIGKVIVETKRETIVLEVLNDTQFENKIWNIYANPSKPDSRSR